MLYFHVLLCKLHLLLALLFFVHGFSGPGPWLFFSRVLGSLPWLFLFLHGHLARVSTSLQFTPFGLNPSVVHDHCKRRCCGHRTSNLLKTHPVSKIRNTIRCAFCLQAHTAPRHTACQTTTQRLAKHSVSSGLPSSPAQARHSDLEHSCARASHTLEFAVFRIL